MIAALVVLLAFQVTPELKQHVDAGLKAKNAGDLDAAIREFQRVVELAPGLAAAHVNLGAVYYDKKDYTHAIPPLRKGLQINPDLPGAQAMLGAALLAQGYASESIPYLEKVHADDLLGVALFESGVVLKPGVKGSWTTGPIVLLATRGPPATVRLDSRMSIPVVPLARAFSLPDHTA